MGSILMLNIVDGRVVLVFAFLSAVALVYLIIRRATQHGEGGRRPLSWNPTRRWLLTLLAGAGVGAFAAIAILFVSEVMLNAFGLPLDQDTHAWVIGAFAAIGIAIVNLWNSRWWRKAIAAVAILIFIATATLGINAGYGLNPTLASLLNVEVGHPLVLPHPVSSPRP